MTTTPTPSPLLESTGLPRFDAIRPEHVEPAVRSLLDALRSTVERLQDDPAAPSWDNFVEPIEDDGERLGRAWGIASHMHSVMDTPEWREAYNAMLPEVTRFYAELGQNLKLFEKYKSIRNSAAFAELRPASGSSTTNCAASASRAPNCPTPRSPASRPSRKKWPV